jgi:hypothetical protein
VLEIIGAAVPAIPGSGPDESGQQFDSVVDVTAVGADPTGRTPVDDVIHDVARDDTLLEFPDGRYRVDDLTLSGLEAAGLSATGDATLVPGPNCEDWLTVVHVEDFLFEGFTLDHRADGCAPTVVMRARDGLEVRDVTKRGRHDGDNTAFGFAITDASGSGLVERLRMPDGSIPVRPVGVYVQGSGDITFRECHVEGFGNNGLYASMADGPVHVEGGLFRDNDRSNVRLGSPNSSVRGAHIVSRATTPTVRNARGVRFSDGPGPVTVEDCDIEMRGGRGMGGIVNAYNGGSLEVRNTRIRVDPAYRNLQETHTGPAVLLDEASAAPTGTRRLENVRIVGGGRGGAAVRVRRGETTFENCCIHQTGRRDGLRFETSPAGVAVVDSVVDVAGERFDGPADLLTRNVGATGGCAGNAPDADEQEQTIDTDRLPVDVNLTENR